jgi:DNA-binding NarL/FixJ family response regulator
MHSETLFAERALNAGALGYVNKADSTEKLLEAIHKVLNGKMALSPKIAERLIRRSMGTDPARTGVEGLSDREMEIFQMIGQGRSVREIADKLCLSPKTIETHREHIKLKLGLQSSAELIRYAAIWTEAPS